MRDNPDYALDDVERVRELVRANPWATFVSFVPGRGLVASHYPAILDEDEEGIVLLSHVGRPDDQKHELGRHEMLVIVQGANGYVSPGWYGRGPAVPTWDFTVVHAYGTPEELTVEENLAVLERLVDRFEDDEPSPHRLYGTPEDAAYAKRIVHATLGFRLRVTRFEGKEKMSQDKPREVIGRVIDALDGDGHHRNPALAERIRQVNDVKEQS